MIRKLKILSVLVATSSLVMTGCNQAEKDEKEPSALTSDNQKFSYAIGLRLGETLKPIRDSVDWAALKDGLGDGMMARNPRLDDVARQTIQATMLEKLKGKQAEAAAETKKSSEAFLAKNKLRSGVMATASGLQYEALVMGTGAHPGPDDMVTVNYRGMLPDGKEFDSSYARKMPLSFQLKQVIPGWVEGLQLMSPGAKYKLYMPASLAYGERGADGMVGPEQAVVYEVELLSVDAHKN